MTTTPLRVGVDLGGTGTRIVLVTSDGDVVKKTAFGTSRDPHRAVAELTDAVRAVVASQPIVSIGIGASGPVDREGIIRNPATLPAFTGVDLRAALGSALEVPVAIDNDAVAAAVFEDRIGKARDAHSVLMVTLGTGVGVAALTGGRPMRGADGEHPEAGHRFVAGQTAPCYCGRSACWEQAVSRSALERAAMELVDAAPEPSAAPAALAACARSGDPSALAVFEAFGDAVGEGLVDLETTFRTETIVVGGSVSQYGDLIAGPIERTFAAVTAYRQPPRVLMSDAGDFGGAIGSALLEQ